MTTALSAGWSKFGGRWRRLAGIGVLVIAAFGVIGVVGIPAAARWGLETVASRELGRAVHVEHISANPYTLRVTLRGLTVDGVSGDATPLLTVREAAINASLSSLLRLAPVLDALTIDGLVAHVVRLEPQRFNFSDIVDRLQAKPRSDEPARFSLNNIEVVDSALHFDDRVTGGRHAITDLRVGIPFLSNLPVDVETKVQPALSGRVDGTPFGLAGETRPFLESHESSITLKFDGLDIPKYLAFSPAKLDFEVPAGKLNTDLRVAFRQAVAATKERAAVSAQVLVTGRIEVVDFALSAPAGRTAAPLTEWKSLAVTIDEFEPLQQRLVVGDVVLDGPAVRVARDRNGQINWARFGERPIGSDEAKPGPPSSPSNSKQPFAVTLKHGAVRNGRVKYLDEIVGRFEQDAVNIQAELSDLTTARSDAGKVKLTADLQDNGSVALDGDLALAPLTGRLRFGARDVRLVVAARYLANVLNGTLDGSSQVDGTLEIGKTDAGVQVVLRDVTVAGKDIKVRGPADGGAALDVAALTLSGGTLDLGARHFTVEKLTIGGPRVVLRRLRDGSINWTRLVKNAPAGNDAGAAAAEPASVPRWSVRLSQASIERGDVLFEDVGVAPTVKLRASALTASAKNIVGDGSEPAEFTLRTRFGSGGMLAANGNVRWDVLAAAVRLDARNLDIAALRPYIADRLNATLAQAELSGRGTMTLATAPRSSAAAVKYKGSARISNLHMLDGSGESDLLKWQVFDAQGIDAQIGEGAPLIALGKLTLSDFYARVIVSEQGRLNLVDLVKRDEVSPVKASAGPQDASLPVPAPDASVGEARPIIRIGAIDVVRGNVNFTDNFIKPNYSANLTRLGGSLTTLASDSAEPATLELAGAIDEEAPVEIRGRLNPLAPKLYLDVEAHTKGVDLPRMTPYSLKYAGYPILKGKLSMDVKYSVADEKLQASNHLFLDQLTFGERVESPTATKLPVLLAVALLKNPRGEIDLNLPISGSLNDPKFSIGGIIVQVIVNLLGKVVTAPFALLAAAFGGGEELGYIDFPPGVSALGTGQSQRLDTLGKALNDRPALKMDIIGRVEPATDTEGVRRAKYEAKLRAVKLRQLTRAGGDSVDPAKVTIAAQERPALIEAVYGDEKIPDKPRNVIGLAKSIPPGEMEQLILKNLAVTGDDLRALANARAAAVRDYLEQTGKVSRDRLFLVEPKLTAEGIKDQGPATRVDFALK